MAKKKAAPASPFVPVEEQPYKIPDNWCWTRFSNIIELISGRDAALTDCNSEGVGIPYILGASNIENNTFTIERWIEKPQVVSNKGDILLSVKGTIGKLYIQKEEKVNISRQIMAIRPTKNLSRELTYLFLQLVCDELREAGNGLIPGISRADILDKAFPFMPFAEQQRIVSRIESLFAKLDEAKEKTQAVVDGFELRKSAILHKAFTGELTEQWRKENGVGLDSWESKSIGDIFEVFSGKGFKEKEYSISGIKLLRISNVTYDALIWDDTKYLPYEYETLVPELLLQADDIVMALNRPITNGRLKISVVNNTEPIILYQRVGCMRKKYDYQVNYLRFALESKDFLIQVRDNLQGSDQPYINLPPLKKLTIPVCQIDEQREVVRILDNVLAKEQQAKEAAEAVLAQIDTMKKAILARAFRGELGTNDPAEEWAGKFVKPLQ